MRRQDADHLLRCLQHDHTAMQNAFTPVPLVAFQPFIKLVQNNLAAMGEYSMSPQTATQAMANLQSLLQGKGGSASLSAQHAAFMELAQKMLQNYTDFLAEVGQGASAMLVQGQAALMPSPDESDVRRAR